MSLSLQTFREFILDLIRASRFWGKLYSNLIVLYCKTIVLRRNSYDALTLLCNAQRRIPNMDITEKCTELIEQIIQENTCVDGQLLPIEHNKLLDAFYKSKRFKKAWQVFAHESEIDRLHLRHFRDKSSPDRQGNMIILKKPVSSLNEKGVLLLKYTPSFEHFLTVFDVRSLVKDYRIVFEPSSYRNIDSAIFLYSGSALKHVLQAAHSDDKICLEKITSSINTIDLGSGDWIDTDTFLPKTSQKNYEIVMVASWLKLKRHEVLFKALKELKKKGRVLRVALIGYPMDLIMEDILEIARKYGVESFCTFYEQLPLAEVAKIVSSSKLAVHLSKYEGTNKASYEAWMCDVPLIVYKYNTGFRKHYINSQTGILADDHELADAIEYVLKNINSFSPREWIVKHSGYLNATKKLNESLREVAIRGGEGWTMDVVPKKNGPNFLYVEDDDRLIMESAYHDLRQYLLQN